MDPITVSIERTSGQGGSAAAAVQCGECLEDRGVRRREEVGGPAR